MLYHQNRSHSSYQSYNPYAAPTKGPTYQYFNERHPKYRKCLVPVRIGAFILTPILLFVTLCLAIVGVLALVYPESYKAMEISHLNREYERDPGKMRVVWQVCASLLLGGNALHVLTLLIALVGIKKEKPGLLVPELVVMGLFLGVLFFALIAFSISMILLIGFVLPLTLVLLLVTSFAFLYFYILGWCYRYLRDKRKARREAMLNARAVRFRQRQSFIH